MALTPQNDEVFFREVDEELRRDQMKGFWLRYGWLVGGAVILGLAIFAGVLAWRHHQQQKTGLAGEQFTQALYDIGQGKRAAATATLDTLSKGPIDGYRAAARMALAAAALEKGDNKAAIAQYQAVAADDGLARPFRDVALIRRTLLEFDTLPPATVVARLKPLAVEGNPWFGSAGELVALSYIKLGKRELAGPLFAAIARDPGVPEGLRSRALRMAGALGADVATAGANPQDNAKE